MDTGSVIRAPNRKRRNSGWRLDEDHFKHCFLRKDVKANGDVVLQNIQIDVWTVNGKLKHKTTVEEFDWDYTRPEHLRGMNIYDAVGRMFRRAEASLAENAMEKNLLSLAPQISDMELYRRISDVMIRKFREQPRYKPTTKTGVQIPELMNEKLEHTPQMEVQHFCPRIQETPNEKMERSPQMEGKTLHPQIAEHLSFNEYSECSTQTDIVNLDPCIPENLNEMPGNRKPVGILKRLRNFFQKFFKK